MLVHWSSIFDKKTVVKYLRKAFKKKKTAIIVTLSLSHFTPTLPKEIGTVIIGTKSM